MNLQEIDQKINQIAEGLVSGQIFPHAIGNDLATLSGINTFLLDWHEEILIRKTSVWGEIRSNSTSDKSAENAWKATEDGIREIKIESRLKKVKELSQTLKKLLRLREDEARNLY